MPLTINTRSYTADTQATNAWIYRDANATAAQPSTLKLGRTPAKPTSDFAGVTKAEAKVSKTPMVGGKALPALIRAESSVPVGTLDADVDLMIADFRSFVAGAAFADLIKKGSIYYG